MMQNDTPSPDSALAQERLLVLLAYGLFLIAPPTGGLCALIGLVIALVRRTHAAGTTLESHYRNQIRVFWTMLVFSLVMMTLFFVGSGLSLFALSWPWPLWPAMLTGNMLGWVMVWPLVALLSLLLVLWYYWRLLRGFIRALDDLPY